MTALASNEVEFEGEVKVLRRPRGGRCRYEAAPGSAVAKVDFTQDSAPAPPGFGFLDDLVDELEADPGLKVGLAEARREIAQRNQERGLRNLATLRMAAGLSQSELADRVGTSQAQISRLESGGQSPNLAILRRLADTLQVSIDELAGAFPL